MLLFNWSVNDDDMHIWLGYNYDECEIMISKVMEDWKEFSCASYYHDYDVIVSLNVGFWWKEFIIL